MDSSEENQRKSTDPQLERTFRGHSGEIHSVSWNNSLSTITNNKSGVNNINVCSGGTDGALMVWSFKPTLRAYRFQGHGKGGITTCLYQPSSNNNKKLIATGGADGTIRLWDPKLSNIDKKGNINKCVVIKAHMKSVRSIVFSKNDPNKMFSCSDDKTIKMWNVNDSKFYGTLKGHTNWVRTIDLMNVGNNHLLASGSDDKLVKIWDTRSSLSCVMSLNECDDFVNSVRFHPNEPNCLAASCKDGSWKLWDLRGGKGRLLQHYSAHKGAANEIAFHPSGNYLISCGADALIKIWDLRDACLFYSISGHKSEVNTVQFSRDGEYFASAGKDKLIFIWKSNLNENEVDNVDIDGPEVQVLKRKKNL